ncbi:unnamed protein product [Caenorhabditis bovis]|uniref:DUF7930 domain-containing protein n=1 Tax=Caenorhabditis bovis TaxID=2654633 RepID=A0A8S1E753_9PELO|nr:unnamed protein product [Caenorhabditis bovis]
MGKKNRKQSKKSSGNRSNRSETNNRSETRTMASNAESPRRNSQSPTYGNSSSSIRGNSQSPNHMMGPGPGTEYGTYMHAPMHGYAYGGPCGYGQVPMHNYPYPTQGYPPNPTYTYSHAPMHGAPQSPKQRYSPNNDHYGNSPIPPYLLADCPDRLKGMCTHRRAPPLTGSASGSSKGQKGKKGGKKKDSKADIKSLIELMDGNEISRRPGEKKRLESLWGKMNEEERGKPPPIPPRPSQFLIDHDIFAMKSHNEEVANDYYSQHGYNAVWIDENPFALGRKRKHDLGFPESIALAPHNRNKHNFPLCNSPTNAVPVIGRVVTVHKTFCHVFHSNYGMIYTPASSFHFMNVIDLEEYLMEDDPVTITFVHLPALEDLSYLAIHTRKMYQPPNPNFFTGMGTIVDMGLVQIRIYSEAYKAYYHCDILNYIGGDCGTDAMTLAGICEEGDTVLFIAEHRGTAPRVIKWHLAKNGHTEVRQIVYAPMLYPSTVDPYEHIYIPAPHKREKDDHIIEGKDFVEQVRKDRSRECDLLNRSFVRYGREEDDC